MESLQTFLQELKRESMKIYFYDHWKLKPEAQTSPVQSVGRSIYSIDASKHNINSIFYRVAKHQPDGHDKNKQYLVRLLDEDYINEFIGTWAECFDFVKDCLSDIGIYKEKLGRKKIKKE